jgi:hypothetical protein
MMNWSAMAALAELVGAAGVIGSLMYLAHQIKRGAVAAKWTGAHAVWTNLNDLLMLLGGDGEVAQIWWRGLLDFDSLETPERVRFSALMLCLANSWDEANHALDAGQIDEWGLQRFTGSMREFAVMPGFKSWYAVRKQWLSDDNRSRLEAIMSEDNPSSGFYGLTREKTTPATSTYS